MELDAWGTAVSTARSPPSLGTVTSELSGNMIDISRSACADQQALPYSARTWELSRRKSVSPHDSTGANLIVRSKPIR